MRAYTIQIFGIVQGVGFRPFIYREAKSNELKGEVKNSGSSVVIRVEGKKKASKAF